MNTVTSLTKPDTKLISLLIVILLFFCQTLSNSTEKSKIIDKYYSKRVTAKKGLNVREQPELNSKSIGIIPYGKSIQIRKEFSETVTINGLSGKWVYIEAYYPKPNNKQEFTVQAGWVFDAYLGDIKMVLKNGFKNFKAGCIGVACDACGSIVFDEDGFFARSLDCDDERNSDIGRWKKIDDYIIACKKSNCNPDISDNNIIKFTLDKSGKVMIEENGIVEKAKAPLLHWEAGGWEWVKERNKNLLPPD